MIAYKLFRLKKNGEITSLFINKSVPLPFGKRLHAENHATKGFAHRPYWHACSLPEAPHLSKKGRVWAEVEIIAYTEMKRPRSQGSKWYLAEEMTILRLLL